MNVVFLSNYFNIHQKPLSDALAAVCSYAFIQTEPMPRERKDMGWDDEQMPDYVCRYDLQSQEAQRLLARADVVIAGAAPEKLVGKCIRRGKLVFRYSERPLKNGPENWKYLPRLVRWHLRNPRGKKICLLSAGAYAAEDYARFGLFRGRALKWGYFPEVPAALTREKRKASILWAGRLLELKHPEAVLSVAAALKEEGYDFSVTILGGGPMEDILREQITQQGLEGYVTITGFQPPYAVRTAMEEADIFLFTSDRREGWGAVLSEAMAAGCAVAASDAPGSVPYLINNEENGLVYPDGDTQALIAIVRRLLREPGLSRRLGQGARETMVDRWNAEVAARRLLQVCRGLLEDRGLDAPWVDGPCAMAEERPWK